jgi:RNA polymerase sigma factor (sigma-70 family)
MYRKEARVTLLLSNRSLLEAFRRGERRAIEQVYRTYVDPVTRLLQGGFPFVSGGTVHSFRGFDNAWDLECAVQDTFIQAFSPAARLAYDGLHPFAPYLLAIARNRVISSMRSEGREQRRRTSLASEPRPHEADSPEQEAERRELRHLVSDFRSGLSEELRHFYDLRYVEDRNLLEVARELGLSRMRARGRDEKLRRLFADFLHRRGYLLSSGRSPSLAGLFLLVRS